MFYNNSMDDSVIKVLRRNGSWKSANVDNSRSDSINTKIDEMNEFSLDKNFGVLAEEIKKRMKLRTSKKELDTDILKNDKPLNLKDNKQEEDIKSSVKKKLLPYLKEIDDLVGEREVYRVKVEHIDDKLEKVKSSIKSIKEDYENNIRELQENINFFDESIDIINKIKGDFK